MNDIFKGHSAGLSSPAEDGESIVPSDGSDLGQVTRALYIGVGGSVRLQLARGTQIDLSNVPSGAILPLRVRRVMASGTSAAGLVGFW